MSLDDLTDRLQWFPAGEVTGVTISGGEPFDQPEALLRLVEWLRGSYCRADQDVLLYSGYPTAVLHAEHGAILAAVDALISEPLDEGASSCEPLRWRGSSNQILTPLSALGRERYALEVGAPSQGEIQIIAGDGCFWMIGVPRSGDLTGLTDSLRDSGINLKGVSWQ